jgi:hypothetical protein
MGQYSKYVVHCKQSAYDIYIGRPSKWGNPFSHKLGTLAQYKVDTREEAIECYRNYIFATPWLLQAAKQELKGKILGCFCFPQSCHGEILAEVANAEDDENS